ncbi:lipocalin-like domain-containing protein [Ferrimonas kyonanensis]|uniref:lipocalin-like domain-containing protein n=1 Tax=Ferrimonas kyonanensis TaxID=364763 RepID=UPI0004803FA2|nr:lipocalin-like domain-containing protein [Ferrimonas kyonanensis]
MSRSVLGLLTMALCACQPDASPPPTSQGLGWHQSLHPQLRQVTPEYRLTFPLDHGAHPEYGLEWWYLTANLNDPQGQPLGLQWTLFRSKVSADTDTSWNDGQLWFSHLAIEYQGRHHAIERWARGGSGQAGVRAAPFSAWLDHWQLASSGSEFLPLQLSADSPMGKLSLTLSDSPLVLHGRDGFSQKTPNPDHASHYYSLPHLSATGQFTPNEQTKALALEGQAWMDREWSSQLMASDYQGWDWLSLHLEDGRALMVFRMRSPALDDYFSGSLIEADGRVTPLKGEQIRWDADAWSTLDGVRYPVGWQLSLPEHQLSGRIETRMSDQRNRLSIPYWEGPVQADGSLQGEGFIEMTGY